MSFRRAHEVATDDGVTIRATVMGQGPPVVFLQGVIGDGDLDWRALVPYLSDQFTCHLPSMRGRGRSDDHPNLLIDRIGKDYTRYVESLGEPAGLVGWSAGAGHALAVSARSEAVRATVSYEPMVSTLMDEEERARLARCLADGRELAEHGDPHGSMRAFASHPFTPADLAAADDVDYFEASSEYALHLLRVFEQLPTYDGPMPEDPEVLDSIDCPVLVLHGSETAPFFAMSAHHVVEHVPLGESHTVLGAGHAGPLTHPDAVAEEIQGFFDVAGG